MGGFHSCQQMVVSEKAMSIFGDGRRSLLTMAAVCTVGNAVWGLLAARGRSEAGRPVFSYLLLICDASKTNAIFFLLLHKTLRCIFR